MGGVGLWRQAAWKWVQCQRQRATGARAVAGRAREKLAVFAARHRPAARRAAADAGRTLAEVVARWYGCALRGMASLAGVGPATMLVVLWSCVLCLSSMNAGLLAFICLEGARVIIHYLGYTPGLFIVGLFGILIMWVNGYFWITGGLLIAGGYMCSLKHARLLILIIMTYSFYSVAICVGWPGILLALALSFLSNDLVYELLKEPDGVKKGAEFEEPKKREPASDAFCGSSESEYCENASASEPENASSTKPFRSSSVPGISHTQKDTVTSNVVKTELSSLDEMNRIMRCSTHYEVLEIPRDKFVDLKLLKKDYHKKVLLVHPDKNMGNSMACESFKKLQCAYEILSDVLKRKDYDEQLRKEEPRGAPHTPRGISRQNGVEFLSEESRRITCTKCGNFHIWICTRRNKAKARWCQDCSLYHQVKDGEGWVENGCSPLFSSLKVDIPRAFVCAESKIFDVSEWAICQGVECKPNTHRASFLVNMVALDRTSQTSYSSRYPWTLDAEMIPDDEFDLWLQQALASGVFTSSPKPQKSWSPFKLPHKAMKSWRRSP